MRETFYTPDWMIQQPVRVTVVGAGGTGAEMLDGLARMGKALVAIGHPGLLVTVYDGDTVSATNLVRQRFMEGDQGLNKALIQVHRFNTFFGTSWTAVPRHFDPDCDNPFSRATMWEQSRPGLLVTCVDSARVRVAIHRQLASPRCGGSLWLDTGNGAFDGQVVLGHLGPVPTGSLRLPNVLDLYPEMAQQMVHLDADGPTCSAAEALTAQEWPVNRQVANAALSLLWGLWRNGSVQHHGAFVNVRTGAVAPMPIDRQFWNSMGYDEGPLRDTKGRFKKKTSVAAGAHG